MTVRQLMILLAFFDPELVVVRSDNSGGLEDIHDVNPELVAETNHEKKEKTVVVLS